jgi:hypothetical protein
VNAGRRYTVAEANTMLPYLRELLPAIREARQGLIASSRRIAEAVAGDGGGVEGSAWFRHQQTLRDAIQGLAERDILLRDPARGLVDFPAEREGRLVFLCWRLDDPGEVAFYHEEHAGYGGRRPV